MTVTELALLAFLDRHGLRADARFYRLLALGDHVHDLAPDEHHAARTRAATGIAYGSAFAETAAIRASDAILFWADFLHMGTYLRGMEPIVARTMAAQGEMGDPGRRLRDVLLLAEADDDTLRRTISFGTTLLFNTLRDESEGAYAAPFARFLRRARRIWVRDALSAARVAHVRNDYATGHFGVDCALLLRREDALRGAEPRDIAPRERGTILTFFAREYAHRATLDAVAATLGDVLGRSVRWLEWGDAHAFPGLRPRPAIPSAGDAPDVHALLAEVARASLVVTDAYHLALTAWNFGIPAVCAFGGHTSAVDDVSSGVAFAWRDKREVFFSQYDALDFLIRPEELADAALLDRRVRHIAGAARDGALCERISARMQAHAASVEAELARELSALLARSG